MAELVHPNDINEETARRIQSGLNALPHTPYTELFSGSADKHLQSAQDTNATWEDSLFFAGAALAHAKAHAGRLDGSVPIDQGWYVSNDYGWDQSGFAAGAIPAYCRGFAQAKERVPQDIQQLVREIYPYWIPQTFGMDYSNDIVAALFDPHPLVMPFDHFTSSRAFVGGEMQYPLGYERRVFPYMKAWDFPPTMWYSDRRENDYPRYVSAMAAKSAIQEAEMIELNGRHEATHGLAIDPLLSFVMSTNTHYWLSEGIVQYLSEKELIALRLSEIKVAPQCKNIIDTLDKPVPYRESLLLTMAIASDLTDGQDIDAGIVGIIHHLHQKSLAVISGEGQRTRTPQELMEVIYSEFDEDKQESLNDTMRDILGTL